jgi:hypothetical protein
VCVCVCVMFKYVLNSMYTYISHVMNGVSDSSCFMKHSYAKKHKIFEQEEVRINKNEAVK